GIAFALEIKLRAHGIDVIRAFTGMQGYWLALREEPDLIITDYPMPEGYGNSTVARLQRHSLTRGIPGIVLTGRTQAFSIRRAMLNLGVAAFLTKPLDFEALLAEIRKHIPLPVGPRPRTRVAAPMEAVTPVA